MCSFLYHHFKNIYLFIFREGKGRGKRGKHQCVVPSRAPPTGDLACNPGMCPDWELNQRSFGLQAGTQPTEPHQPGLTTIFHKNFKNFPTQAPAALSVSKLQMPRGGPRAEHAP